MSTAEPTGKPVMQYFWDGHLIKNPSVNSLSGFAYFYTKGIDKKDRISTKRLEELLAEAGVAEPRNSNFEATLPNGRVIKGVLAGTKALAPSKPKSAKRPAKDTTAKPTGKPPGATSRDRAGVMERIEERADSRRTREATTAKAS
jgi:hypothetical protein